MTQAAVAFGGNLGRPDIAFRDALLRLEEAGLALRARSRLWRSAPWGVADQPEFLNAVALFETGLSARQVLAALLRVEEAAGRTRAERWGPRVLDLDLLWMDGELRDEADLTVPHPRLTERSFVLAPLRDVAPEWRHPVTRTTAGELLADLEASGRATPCAAVDGVLLGEEAGTGACLR